ncbi:redoxin domain-containing protein [bacterium]|nr:redoxin domain-containing protein [bacterium]
MIFRMKTIAGAATLALMLAAPALSPAQLGSVDKVPESSMESTLQEKLPEISPKKALEAFAGKYAGLGAYSATVKLSALGGDGKPMDQFPAQTAEFAYWAPNDLSMDFDALDVTSTGGEMLVSLVGEKSAMVLDVPEEGGIQALMEENPLVGNILGQIPILDIVVNGTDGFANWNAEVTELDSKPAVALTDPEDGTHTLFIDPLSGSALRSQLSMGNGGPKLLVEYDDQAFGEDVPKPELSTEIPEGYDDITAQVVAMMKGPDELIGQPAPDFTLKTMEGKEVSLADQKGKVVVMDFWATWCPPCKKGMPILQKVADEMKDENVVFWAMNTDQDPMEERKAKIVDFTSSNDITMTQVMTGDDEDLMTDYLVKSIPTTVIVAPDGKIANVHVGLVPDLADVLREDIKSAMESK